MGGQIRFFMTELDEIKFLHNVIGCNDIIIDNKGINVNFPDNNELPMIVYIAGPESQVIIDQNGFLDLIRSEVIEFSTCIIREKNELYYGRLWAKFEYFNNDGEMLKKTKQFEDKFVYYKKLIVKGSILSKDKKFYISHKAYQLYLDKSLKMMTTPALECEFEFKK